MDKQNDPENAFGLNIVWAKTRHALAIIAVSALLVACGGGGGGGGSDCSEIEPNDSPGNATVISVPGSCTGTVDEFSDPDDLYSFTTGSSGSFTIRLDGFNPATHDLDVYLIDDSFTVILNGSASLDSVESFTHSLTGGVLYYIWVNAWSTSGTASYTLTVTRN